MNVKTPFFGLVFMLLLMQSCKSDKADIPSVANINIDYKALHYDKSFFNIDSTNYKSKIVALKKQDTTAFKVYTEFVLGIRPSEKIVVKDEILAFTQNGGVKALRDSVEMAFADMPALETEIQTLLKYYKLHLPSKPTPKVVYGINEFGYGAYTYEDSLVGIGLDLFLGTDFPYNTQLFPEYIQYSMDRKHLTTHVAKAMAKNVLGETKGSRLLDQIIYNGKVLYIASQLLPHLDENVILEYTPEQQSWCTTNELEIWVYLLNDNLIYTRNNHKMYKLINPSPMGPADMPQESPGKIGNWVGLQIIKKYMEKVPGTKIVDLIKLNDAQDVLTKAHYRPK